MQPNTDNSFDRRSVLLMLASVILFAINTLLIRAVSEHTPGVDGWLATFLRGVFGLILVFAIYGWGRGLKPERLLKGRLITIRGFVGALSIIAFYITIVKIGAGRAVILNLTYPIFATIFAAVWLKEKIGRSSMIWMLVSFCGLVVFLSEDGKLLEPSLYDLLALAGAAGAGWVVVIIRRLRHEEHPSTIYASQALYSMLLASPSAMKLTALPTSAWVGLIIASVIVTIAQLVMTRAYQFMSVSRGSSLQMILPLVTAAGSYVIFGESFHWMEITGALLTLFATWRIVSSRK
jgi:drug/metabolite transporter (DMT)-like permease